MLLRVEHLSRHFPVYESGWSRRLAGVVRAVEDVSFTLEAGRTLIVLGEAGAGKTTLARLLARVDAPDGGQIVVEGQEVSHLAGRDLRNWRKRAQYVYPDARTSLNARQTVGEILEEPLRLGRERDLDSRRGWLENICEALGINSFILQRRPPSLSSAMLQKVAMARGLALRPALLICDGAGERLEPAAHRPLLEALVALQRRAGFGLIWTARQPDQVRGLADEMLVLYRGRGVEWGSAEHVLNVPRHPYSQRWLGRLPESRAASPPYQRGCRYHPECPQVMDICRTEAPAMRMVVSEHRVACYLYPDAAGSQMGAETGENRPSA